jgi:GAF domain-containing protein
MGHWMRDCLKCEDIERRQLIRLQRDMLEDVARGRSLKAVMTNLCRRAEALASGAVCSILIVDGRQLKTLAAPSLPSQYSRAIDGLEIGPGVGSCGSAAHHGKPVVASDIVSDTNWVDFRHLALPLGLHACWSTPIIGPDGGVLGTLAFYFREARGPNKLEKSIVQACVRICSIAI